MTGAEVIFDHGPCPGGTAFRRPRAIIRADTPAEVAGAMTRIERARADGFWLAGAASYELGYVYSAKLRDLMPADRAGPLLQFGVFDGPVPHDWTEPAEPAAITAPEPAWDFAAYHRAFDRVRGYIGAGDIYQANLTFPMTARRTGSLRGLYRRLRDRQPVPHGALVDLGGPALLSRSPELFFAVDGGEMTARPMKGTVRRGATATEDAARAAWLRGSEKNRAENLMIVDLLRNDIGRIAEIGSVRVPELFTVETYATLHQMTSRITARMADGTGMADIFEALFPCGSITGAPKIRAMQVLRELEHGPRDAYCGAIGWIAPDGRMTFGVAIRTLTCTEDGDVRLNVGGGVVHDSTARDEYDEALLKARFALLDAVKTA